MRHTGNVTRFCPLFLILLNFKIACNVIKKGQCVQSEFERLLTNDDKQFLRPISIELQILLHDQV